MQISRKLTNKVNFTVQGYYIDGVGGLNLGNLKAALVTLLPLVLPTWKAV